MMRTSRRLSFDLRGAALLPAAALVLHQLRYAVAYHHDAGPALAAQGHGYLGLITPVAALLLAAGSIRLVRRAAGGSAGAPRSFGRLWTACAALLAAVHFGQEWVESVLATGHPGGLEGLLGHGAWAAALLAVALGGLVAAALRGSAAAAELLAPERVRGPRLAAVPVLLAASPPHPVPRATPLRSLGARAPPPASA
jgi:hypothetical protein